MAGTVGTHLFAQVGFIVKDIEETKRKWAAFLGVEVPETQPCGDYAVTQTVFEGKPAPEADSLLAFFDVGPGLQLELIQPNEAPSTWRNFLNEHGEGNITLRSRCGIPQNRWRMPRRQAFGWYNTVLTVMATVNTTISKHRI